MKILRIWIPFMMGFFGYALIEIIARGYTHWTMAVTGGTVLAMLYLLYTGAPQLPPMLLYLMGAVVITATELFVGMQVNVRLGWDVWDYSDLPLHFNGQICLLYSAFWFLLCIPARLLCRRMAQKLHTGK